MEKFLNPVDRYDSKSVSNNVVKYKANPNSPVIAPYDGYREVLTNSYRITHSIGGEIYYSDIKNIGRVDSYTSYVRQGDVIGYTGNDDIEYEVLNKNMKRVNIEDVFKEKKPKDDKGEATGLDVLKTVTLPLSIPLSLVKSAGKYAFNRLTGQNESVKVDENVVNEDINRIKKLMKK